MTTAAFHSNCPRIRRRPLVIAAALAAWGGSMSMAAAASRYVGPSGGDAGNDCAAWVTPCQTIAHAIAQSVVGDHIWLGAGTYGEYGLTVSRAGALCDIGSFEY